jgi:hypothetical protein
MKITGYGFSNILLEKPHGKYFITFVTWERLELTPEARQVVLEGV